MTSNQIPVFRQKKIHCVWLFRFGIWNLFVSCILVIGYFLFLIQGIAFADEKQWAGVDDGTTWENALNWFSPVVPTVNDDVIINMKDAEVLVSQNFFAKTLTIGGREESSFTTNDFIYGIIGPESNTDNALYIKKDGLVVLKGAGDIVLKGSFKNSEETLPSEPAFMFGLE